jgi:topoisomerase-4 subunit A
MSAANKKDHLDQTELPIAGTPPAASPATPPAAPAALEKPAEAQATSADHVVAQAVETVVVHKPFDPKKLAVGLHTRVAIGFLDYASYVIRDRAIPNLTDGLKPVQRRILWSLHEKDDGRFIKVANVVGHTMQYHPHGDASIGDALVVLANKRYLIEGQGNYGNLFTGDPAAAPRYIECRLTELARTEVFNDAITDFVPSYDGRNREPVALPSKLPLALMLGTEGIAVGLAARILPHNFPELLEAQIAILQQKPFKCLPDFPTGGLMDARDYQDGKGSVKVRARLKAKDNATVLITEIPPSTTTDSLLTSIEDASRKGKLKVKSINDYTSEKVEIEIKCPPGVEAEKLMDALYAFTDCEVSITSHIVVIRNSRPVELTVSELLQESTHQLVAILKRELELREKDLLNDLHYRTLERIFIEERLYKLIEKSRTNEAVRAAVCEGFQPFKKELIRALADEDVEKLLQVRIRRISLFDINKHREEMEQTKKDLESTRKNLKNLTAYVISHLQALLEKYGPLYPRLTTKSARHEEVDVKAAAFKAFKVSYDRESGYVGYKVSGEEFKLECTKFDKILIVLRDGTYRVTELPEKLFVGPELYYCGLPERDRVFTCAYTDREASYLKRFTFGGTILNKIYACIPEKSRILYLAPDTPKTLYIRYKPAPHQKISQQTCDPGQVEVKKPRTLGRQISIKDISSVTAAPTRGWDDQESTTKIVFA